MSEEIPIFEVGDIMLLIAIQAGATSVRVWQKNQDGKRVPVTIHSPSFDLKPDGSFLLRGDFEVSMPRYCVRFTND